MSKIIKKVEGYHTEVKEEELVECPNCGIVFWNETEEQECPSCGETMLPKVINTGGNYVPGYTLVKCDCGNEVRCADNKFTNTCHECGRDYNMNGAQLAPRSQWNR